MSVLETSSPQAPLSSRLNPGLWLEALLACVVLFVASGAVFPLLRRLGGQMTVTVGEGGPEGKIYVIAYAAFALLALPLRRQLLAVLRADPLPWTLPLLALLSVFWSTDPSHSLRSAVLLVGGMLFGAYLALRFDVSGLVAILATLLTGILILSVLAAVVPPGIGMDLGPHAGAMRGVFGHKNLFGRTSVLAFAVFSVCVLCQPKTRAISVPLALGAVVLVALSHSRTALVAVAAVGLVLSARPVFQRVRVPTWFVAATFALAVAVLVGLAWSQRSAVLQRDVEGETLTGRTLLWLASGFKIAERPLLGYGYLGFWGGRSEAYVDVWRIVGWAAPNAHNAFVDVALDLGLLGAVLLLVTCIRTCAHTIALQRRLDLSQLQQVWPSCFAIFTMLSFLTEGGLLQNHLYWILFTATTVLCTKYALLVQTQPVPTATSTPPRRADAASVMARA